ncbi:MAG: pyridoxamine 5'-phosphate oxidase [Chlamydiia bacterium]|nr:pyridoxamine 5'-phosphate oxidase [Chlamydiia bacterium]
MPRKLKKKTLHTFRHEYGNTPLLENELRNDPMSQFSFWLKQAIQAKVFEPNGMILCTSTLDNHPSSRTILLKEYDESGLVFFSNTHSRKGEHLSQNPNASLTFWWKEIYRQVNFEGAVVAIPRKEVKFYFFKRPKLAQLSALASAQSEPLASRYVLEETFLRLKKKYRGKKVPVPSHFGGYRFVPTRVEFWQGRQSRLHDRFVYVKVEDSWLITRLAP